MGDVISLDCMTSLDVPVDKVLDSAKEQYERAIVIGANGTKLSVCSSSANMYKIIYGLHMALDKIARIIAQGDNDD